MPPAPTAQTSTHDRLLTPAEVGAWLSIPADTLRKWRQHGQGPRFAKLGRHVRYAKSDVDSWLADQQQRTAVNG